MNQCNIVGRVLKAKEDTTKSGKPCAKVRVETTKKVGDNTYSTRFDVVVYGQDAATSAMIPQGTLVSASGEVGAYVNEYQGKTYANIQLTGRIQVIDPVAEPKRQEAPRPTQAPTQPVVEDDVPF